MMPQPKDQQAQDSSATIRKGIYLSALIYVEGDQAPAADFAGLAKAALKDVLTRALKGNRRGLTMTLKTIEVRNDVEDEDQGDGNNGDKGDKGGKGSKFEF